MTRVIDMLAAATLLVAAASSALAGDITALPDFDSPPQISTSSSPRRSQSLLDVSAQSGNPLWTIPLASLTATRERPIFTPSRRPPPPVQPIAVTPAPAPIAIN